MQLIALLIKYIEDNYYLGSRVKDYHDNWKNELCEVLDPSKSYYEWILSGAIGIGKTSVATVANLYKLKS